MTEQELRERLRVKDEARSWLRTPYQHRGHVKDAGIDCARILIEVFAGAGMIEAFDPGKYTKDWYMHRTEEVYLQTVERYCGAPLREGPGIGGPDGWEASGYAPFTGDILVWRVGRTYSHSGIVTDWPFVVHASAPSRIVEEVSVINTPVYVRPVKHYSIWGPK